MIASMCAVLAFGYTFPPEIDEGEYNRMKAENQALQIENKSANLEAQRLITQIAKMERVSSRITRELAAD
jgi:hypothetical protein